MKPLLFSLAIAIAIVILHRVLSPQGIQGAPRRPPAASTPSLQIRPLPADPLPAPGKVDPGGLNSRPAATRRAAEEEPTCLRGISTAAHKAYELIDEAWALQGQDDEKECGLLLAALELDPDDQVTTREAHRNDMRFGTYRQLAHLQVKLHRPDDALRTYGALLTHLPSPDAEIWVGIAEAWEAKGDNPRALAYFWTAAETGYDSFYDGYSRHFLYDAIRRLAPDETQRLAQLQKEVDRFGDWIAYYHLAEYYHPVGDAPPREAVPSLEKVVAALKSANDALDRLEATSGSRDQELHARLQREYEEASSLLQDEREYLRADLEGR